MSTTSPAAAKHIHPFQSDDPRLMPIHDKVMAQRRLSADDALALDRSGDILAIGWLANHVRERMHGDVAYFNVIGTSTTPMFAWPPAACAPSDARRMFPALTPWRSKRLGTRPPPATPRRSPSFTSSAGCIPTCRSSTILTSSPA